ncbi:hypothetical protein BCU36_011795 [Vibrio lentus]|uniref:hypothetical protein n=1 Tax=Vibrio lentus TaxID=136468 RepID=UPI000C81C4B1|nr:hypothetical protein [Vibrio lentus]PMI80182.1 hypothetical protein BCU36_17040 [Vibrio lentus]
MRNQNIGHHQTISTSAEIEAALLESHKQKQAVTVQKQPFSATTLFVPKSRVNAEYTLSFVDGAQPDKRVLYKTIIAAYNYALFDTVAAVSAKTLFAQAAGPFIEWLNAHAIENRYNILKEYESQRMDAMGNHGGNSPLIRLMTLLTYALDSTAFRREVSVEDYAFVMALRETKISPNVNLSQKSLASYFGALDWLRQDDIGIGEALYTVLASPKLTVSSLSLTAATVILQLDQYQSELKSLVQGIQSDLTLWTEMDFSSLSRTKKCECIGNSLYLIIRAYHQSSEPSKQLKSALEVLLLSNAANDQGYFRLREALSSQAACDDIFLNKRDYKKKVSVTFCGRNIISCTHGALFSWEFLCSLLRRDAHIITQVAKVMFGWLMASLTVQTYDIPKLTHSSFRKMRVSGRVTQIECDYFKGRAKVFHTTRALSARQAEGKAILTYLDAHPEGVQLYTKLEPVISNGIRSLTGVFRRLLECESMANAIGAMHNQQDTPCVIPAAFCALIKHGTHAENSIKNARKVSFEERVERFKQSESPCQQCAFGLQAIKNSAVHAFSDPYTYHYLINRNSHTNKTEKTSYLTEDNEAWMNSAGRITREVMLDLIQNVFDLDFTKDQENQIADFNSEFMMVSEGISYKSEEMKARLRLVTEQTQGTVDEVGVIALSPHVDDAPLSPIVVVDSPLTVLKMLNYLHEFKKHYKKLLATSPDFLFKTVMPTVEWMENTLKKISKPFRQVGQAQFNEMIKNGVVMSVFHSL